MGDAPLCSFSASATVSNPKCVVPGASFGAADFGGGGYSCAHRHDDEKKRADFTCVALLASLRN